MSIKLSIKLFQAFPKTLKTLTTLRSWHHEHAFCTSAHKRYTHSAVVVSLA